MEFCRTLQGFFYYGSGMRCSMQGTVVQVSGLFFSDDKNKTVVRNKTVSVNNYAFLLC